MAIPGSTHPDSWRRAFYEAFRNRVSDMPTLPGFATFEPAIPAPQSSNIASIERRLLDHLQRGNHPNAARLSELGRHNALILDLVVKPNSEYENLQATIQEASSAYSVALYYLRLQPPACPETSPAVSAVSSMNQGVQESNPNRSRCTRSAQNESDEGLALLRGQTAAACQAVESLLSR